ncbi:MAG: hypothetical protein IPO15_20930 [Anaerolineae bacterium]|uniref:hypothetical protein n=1 Tax=Candidatus Amarolinea dominans TaxID=3140696 RepID=UPI003135827E|nr:hypothetical protein [Anaerolineae bacterium]
MTITRADTRRRTLNGGVQPGRCAGGGTLLSRAGQIPHLRPLQPSTAMGRVSLQHHRGG